MAIFPAAFASASLLLLAQTTAGWTTTPPHRLSLTRLCAALPPGYQEIGTRLILDACEPCGASEDQLDIEWKAGRIVVTVHGDSYVSDHTDQVLDEDDGIVPQEEGVDMTELARAINTALDDGGVGLAIAEAHEIEVTTPGAPNELSGIMFEAYKGFDVNCQFMDPKTKKSKTVSGRLHERTNDFTVINIKGKMKKIKNDNVVSVTLPAAKREKGTR